MGYQLQRTLGSGFTIDYWSLQAVNVNYSVRQASWKLLGYKDEETFKKGGAQATTLEFQVRDDEFDKFFPRNAADNICTQCYLATREKDPAFSEAKVQ